MKEWFVGFCKRHGERLTFLGLAVVMGSIFMVIPGFEGAGKTILIGAAMLLYNKARSPEKKESESAG